MFENNIVGALPQYVIVHHFPYNQANGPDKLDQPT